MPSYKAPLRDMRFLLNEVADPARLQSLPGCEEVTPDLIGPVLEEAAKLCEEVLLPLNRPGDEEGCGAFPMTAIMSLEDAGGGKTSYRAVALHKDAADRETHEKMGFHEGWGTCAAQLEQVAQELLEKA